MAGHLLSFAVTLALLRPVSSTVLMPLGPGPIHPVQVLPPGGPGLSLPGPPFHQKGPFFPPPHMGPVFVPPPAGGMMSEYNVHPLRAEQHMMNKAASHFRRKRLIILRRQQHQQHKYHNGLQMQQRRMRGGVRPPNNVGPANGLGLHQQQQGPVNVRGQQQQQQQQHQQQQQGPLTGRGQHQQQQQQQQQGPLTGRGQQQQGGFPRPVVQQRGQFRPGTADLRRGGLPPPRQQRGGVQQRPIVVTRRRQPVGRSGHDQQGSPRNPSPNTRIGNGAFGGPAASRDRTAGQQLPASTFQRPPLEEVVNTNRPGRHPVNNQVAVTGSNVNSRGLNGGLTVNSLDFSGGGSGGAAPTGTGPAQTGSAGSVHTPGTDRTSNGGTQRGPGPSDNSRNDNQRRTGQTGSGRRKTPTDVNKNTNNDKQATKSPIPSRKNQRQSGQDSTPEVTKSIPSKTTVNVVKNSGPVNSDLQIDTTVAEPKSVTDAVPIVTKGPTQVTTKRSFVRVAQAENPIPSAQDVVQSIFGAEGIGFGNNMMNSGGPLGESEILSFDFDAAKNSVVGLTPDSSASIVDLGLTGGAIPDSLGNVEVVTVDSKTFSNIERAIQAGEPVNQELLGEIMLNTDSYIEPQALGAPKAPTDTQIIIIDSNSGPVGADILSGFSPPHPMDGHLHHQGHLHSLGHPEGLLKDHVHEAVGKVGEPVGSISIDGANDMIGLFSGQAGHEFPDVPASVSSIPASIGKRLSKQKKKAALEQKIDKTSE